MPTVNKNITNSIALQAKELGHLIKIKESQKIFILNSSKDTIAEFISNIFHFHSNEILFMTINSNVIFQICTNSQNCYYKAKSKMISEHKTWSGS